MKIRTAVKLFALLLTGFSVVVTSDANAAVVGTNCTVTSVGWREDLKALRVICAGITFFNREASANPTCTLKTTEDTVKIFQTTANASLLSGKTVQIYYDTQSGCSNDTVIREMYLMN